MMLRRIHLEHHKLLPSKFRLAHHSSSHAHKYSSKSGSRKLGSRQKQIIDIKSLLSKPSWSIRSLLPPELPAEEMTPEKLHHLLRLSALPLPSSAEDQAKMLKTLHSQLHFVRDIQTVDTTGVPPLQSIRDETLKGLKSSTISLDDLQQTLDGERVLGKRRRVRKIRAETKQERHTAPWDAFGGAKEMVVVGEATFFVVRSGK